MLHGSVASSNVAPLSGGGSRGWYLKTGVSCLVHVRAVRTDDSGSLAAPGVLGQERGGRWPAAGLGSRIHFCMILTVNIVLSEVEARVLGSLVEKEITTPEYYPLSLNALINACNQKSNRDPVMQVDEDAVRRALRALNDQALARSAISADSRVPKYEHRLAEAFNFHRHEIAVLCVLLLRGPQTPGELRVHAERMYQFEDLEGVHAALQLLMRREPPLVKVLPRIQGTKEVRYAHLFSGDVEVLEAPSRQPALATSISDEGGRIARLEHEMAGLKKELADLRQKFADFQKQFE